MKERILGGFLGAVIFLSSGSTLWSADYEASHSTNTTGSVTTGIIPNTDPGDILVRLLINQRSPSACTVTLYDSSATATTSLGTVDISTGATSMSGPFDESEYTYMLRVSSAITISKSCTSGNVTVLWQNKR